MFSRTLERKRTYLEVRGLEYAYREEGVRLLGETRAGSGACSKAIGYGSSYGGDQAEEETVPSVNLILSGSIFDGDRAIR